ncbi:MAG: hypothetical protein Q4G47_03665, partial [Lachnospiraceae bacterium]|nr:hypothetical protein [Lachnospiraceae bacterium]
MKKRNILIFIAQILITAVTVLVMFRKGASLAMTWYSDDMKSRLEELNASLTEARDKTLRDSSYLEFIDSEIPKYVTFCLRNNPDAAGSADELNELCDILDIENLFIIDSGGNIITEARHDDNMAADLKSSEYSGLLKVSPDNPISDFYYASVPDSVYDESEYAEAGGSDDSEDSLISENTESETDDPATDELIHKAMTYYVSGYFSPNRFVVIKNSSMEYRRYHSGHKSEVQSLMSGSKYGKNGFFFIVEAHGYVFYYPETDGKATSLDDLALPNAIMKEGYTQIFNLKGDLYFCRSHTVKWPGSTDDVTIVCTIPVIEIYRTVLFVILLPCIIIIISLILMRLFAKYLVADSAGKAGRQNTAGVFHRRLVIMTLIYILCTLLSGVFSNVLYFYAQQFQADTKRADTLAAAVDDLPRRQESGFEVYDQYLTILTKTASYVLSHNTDYRSREKLEELRDLLHAKHLLVYDSSGKVTASDRNYNGLSLSDNPEYLSNQFLWVIRGEPILIQRELDFKHLGAPFLFSGAPILTHDGSYDGLVQLAMNPDIYYRIIDSSTLSSSLSLYGRGEKSSALAIEKDSNIVHSSNNEYDYLSAENIGFKEGQLTAGFTGFVRLLNRDMLCCCSASDAYTVCIVTDPS